jgi:hypothetical protein
MKSTAKLNGIASPQKPFFQDAGTPKRMGAMHRPSNITDQRSTAIHSHMPSPSNAMFKTGSFQDATRRGMNAANYNYN